MRIAFDVSPLHVPHSRGLARAVAGAVEALEQRARIEVVRLHPPAGAALRRWRHAALPGLVAHSGALGLHSFTSAFPLRGRMRRVQTVHELPWLHGERENSDWKHRLWARYGALRADRVACPSAHVAADLARCSRAARGRIALVPFGVGAPFSPEPARGEVDERLLGKYRVGEDPLLVCLGAARAKKNLAALLHGLAEYKRARGRRVQLLVTGGDGPELRRNLGLASQLGLAGWVQTLDAIDEADLPGVLRLASLVPLLSRSEGFGFPVLEALACGTPVLVPEQGAQSELAGPLGIRCEPEDARSVAAGLTDALARREQLRWQLPARAAEYSWARCAQAIEQLWAALA